MSRGADSLLAATDDGLFELAPEPVRHLEGNRVVALDETGSWAIVEGRGLWQNRGGAWAQVAPGEDHRPRCVLSIPGGVFVGTSNAHLLHLHDGRLEIVGGFEDAEGRADWYTPWGGPPDVRSLTATPSGALLANVHVGGILRSSDGGGTWTQTIDIDTDVHQVIAPGDLVVAATARGLATGDSGGGPWSFDEEGLHATYARAVAVAGAHVLLSVSDGPRGGHAALYRRPLKAEGSFRKCETGLPEWFDDNIDTGCLASRGATVAFGTRDGRVFLSSDSGETWTEAAADLPAVNWLAFA